MTQPRRPNWDPTPTFVFRPGEDLTSKYEAYANDLDSWDPEWHLTDLGRMDPELAALAIKRREAAGPA